MLDLHWVMPSFYFPICAIWRHMVHCTCISTNSGDSYGQKLCSTHSGFMSQLNKSKRYNLIDMFNDTSRYLDDIFTIDNPEFERGTYSWYISNRTSVEQSKYFRQRNFFLWFNMKVIGSDFHTIIYDKPYNFVFPIVKFPCLSGDVPRLPSYGISFRS